MAPHSAHDLTCNLRGVKSNVTCYKMVASIGVICICILVAVQQLVPPRYVWLAAPRGHQLATRPLFSPSPAVVSRSPADLPQQFDWRAYSVYYLNDSVSKEYAEHHYRQQGAAAGSIYRRLRVILKYGSFGGCFNQVAICGRLQHHVRCANKQLC